MVHSSSLICSRFLWLFVFFLSACANPQLFTQEVYHNPEVPLEIWEEVKPYFLPENHPVKKKLDKIFKKSRATLSPETFIQSGFYNHRPHRLHSALVSEHKDLKGYLVKVYLDTQVGICEWERWLNRIRGAACIRNFIEQHHYKGFVVPKKWIYPLPIDPITPEETQYQRKNFILIVEDMQILNSKENKKAYAEQMTQERLTELYTILEACQLSDSTYIGNIPFTKRGKIAFVDTEIYLTGHSPNYRRLRNRLTFEMQNNLDVLMAQSLAQ